MSTPDAPAGQPPGWSLQGEIRGAFREVLAGGLLIAVVTAGALAYLLIVGQPRINRLDDGIAAVNDVHEAMLDQETGLRGYVLTHDPAYLQPYRSGQAQLVRALPELRNLQVSGGLTNAVVETKVAVLRWQGLWAEPAAQAPTLARLAADPQAVEAFLAQGKQLFDAYRGPEARLARSAHAASIDARVTTRWTLAGTSAAALAVALVTLAFTVRRRRRFHGALVAPVNGILGALDQIRAGDFAAPRLGPAPVELARIGSGLETVATSLATQHRIALDRRDEAETGAARLRMLLELPREISGSLSLRYVVDAVANAGRRICGAERVVVWLVEDNQELLVAQHDSQATAGSATRLPTVEVGTGAVGRAAKYGRSTALEDLDVDPLAGQRPAATHAVPMIIGARVVGVIECRWGATPGAEPDLSVLETLAAQAASAIEAARLHHQVEELSVIDPLTRLANRRRLEADLRDEGARARRYDRPLAFVMFDLDHFKRINDTYGHQRADEVLQEVAGILTAACRESDSVYRYGGEELALLARESDTKAAFEVAERIRAQVEERFRRGGREVVTISAGVAAIPCDAHDGDALVGAADAALYAAKHGGRNRVCVAPTSR